jgi:hypothetical protein
MRVLANGNRPINQNALLPQPVFAALRQYQQALTTEWQCFRSQILQTLLEAQQPSNLSQKQKAFVLIQGPLLKPIVGNMHTLAHNRIEAFNCYF